MQKRAKLVELEKCCQSSQTHIYLQNFVLIQPRTSPTSICKILLIFPILPTLTSKVGVAVSGAGVLVAGALAVLAYNYAALRSRREKHELVQCAPAES